MELPKLWTARWLAALIVSSVALLAIPPAVADDESPESPQFLTGVSFPDDENPLEHRVLLTWQPPESGDDVLYYKVYRAADYGLNASMSFVQVGTATENEFEETLTMDGTEGLPVLQYYVTAVTDDGESSPSNKAYIFMMGVFFDCVRITPGTFPFVHVGSCEIIRRQTGEQICDPENIEAAFRECP